MSTGWSRVGAAVCRARSARGWTQEHLAQAANVGRTSVTNLENGRRRVSVEALARIVRALELADHEAAGLLQLASEREAA